MNTSIRFLLLILLILIIGLRTGESQMDAQNLVSVLNFSKTLIQDGEIQFIFYEKLPTHPDDIGKTKQQILAFREQELRDAHKDSDPEALRKAILKNIEQVKTYHDFGESDEHFFFEEVNLVFQLRPDSTPSDYRINYNMEQISLFDNYPSLAFKRYFNGGFQTIAALNTAHKLSGRFPNQFATGNRIGLFSKDNVDVETDEWIGSFPLRLPPDYINETRFNLEQSTLNGKNVYVLTHFPFEEVMSKIYIHMAKLPEIFREEFYYRSPSPNANKEGYWLRLVVEYSNFVTIEKLGIVIPKVYEAKEFRGSDGFLQRITKVVIQEMEFNQGLPANYFDWDETEFVDDDGMRKYIVNNIKNEKIE